MGALFVAWGAHFIQLASFRSSDGRAHYLLFDDAMISMRYAWNVTHGRGLVWNPGERVEGFTNPLMVLVMTLPALALDRSHAILAVQVLGVGILLATGFVTMQIARHAFEDETPEDQALISVLSACAVWLYYPLAYWTLSGMETGLLALLAALAVWVSIRQRGSRRASLTLAVLLGLMFYTRPDALPQAALIWLFRAGPARKEGRRALGIELAILAGMVAVSFLARRAYYGEWLPNTYVLKMTGLPRGIRLESGWGFTSVFLASTWFALVLAGLSLIVAFRPVFVLFFALFTTVTLYQIWVGGDPWPYWRIMSPYVPMLLLASLGGALGGARRVFRFLEMGSAQSRAGLVAPFALCGALFLADRAFMDELTFKKIPYQVSPNRRYAEIGLELARVCMPDARIGAFAAGTMPYYADLPAIDFLGKADKHIARLQPDPKLGWSGMKSTPGHNKYDLRYSIVELKPDFLTRYAWGHDDLKAYVEARYVKTDIGWFLKDSPHVRWNLVRGLKPVAGSVAR
jgi:hypothetical protein